MQDNQDTFFLDPVEALRVAGQQNRCGADGSDLQICYYDGEKIDSELPNLIHLSIDNLVEELAQGIYRLPSKIDFTGLEISSDIKVDVLMNFNLSIQHAQIYRNQYNNHYYNMLKNSKLDFNEPLRFYITANINTQVMQYVSKNIVDVLEDKGFKVLYHLRMNIEDNSCFKTLLEFNPHVTININHFNNLFLNEDAFNFVWFQDGMPILLNNEKIFKRERDFVFHLIDGLGEYLSKKGIKSELMSFMLSSQTYKPRENIKKEKKIVFIGSSYSFMIDKFKNDPTFETVYSDVLSAFEQTSCLRRSKEIKDLAHKHNKSEAYIEHIYAYLVRDYCVEKLCSIDTEYSIEIYGSGWGNNQIVAPYYRGMVSHGEEISKIYNSAAYGYCPGGYVLMQRTLECAFSETVPLVLDVRADRQDIYDKKVEDGIEFFHINKLVEMLQKEPEVKNFDFIKEHYSYEHFVNRILEMIKGEIA